MVLPIKLLVIALLITAVALPQYLQVSKKLLDSGIYNDKPRYQGDQGKCYYYSSELAHRLDLAGYDAVMQKVGIPCKNNPYFSYGECKKWGDGIRGGHYVVMIRNGFKSPIYIESTAGYVITDKMRYWFGL